MLRKIGKIYFIDISHPSLNKRFRRTTRTSDLILAKKIHDGCFREIIEKSILGSSIIKKIDLKVFINEFIKYSKINHSSKTTETYMYAFKKLLEIVPDTTSLLDLNPFHFEKIKSLCANKTTYNIYYHHLRAALNRAIKWKYLKTNVLNDVDKFKINIKLRRDIHISEFKTLLKTITDDDNREFADFLIFMFITGLRRSEMLNLSWNSINYELNYFTLLNTKGKEDVNLPLNIALFKILNNRLGENKPFNYLPNFATKKFKYYCRLASLPEELVLHSIRHSTTTQLFEKGEHPLIIQNLIRHKDLKTTMDYTHTTPQFLKPAIDKMAEIVEELIEE